MRVDGYRCWVGLVTGLFGYVAYDGSCLFVLGLVLCLCVACFVVVVCSFVFVGLRGFVSGCVCGLCVGFWVDCLAW